MTDFIAIEIAIVIMFVYLLGVYLSWFLALGLVEFGMRQLRHILSFYFRPLPTPPTGGVEDGECHTSIPDRNQENRNGT